MNVLIKSALIINPLSPFHLMKKDIYIKSGIITKISDKIPVTDDLVQVIEEKNLHVSAGWFDMKVNFCDPGFEQKEDVFSGIDAAASGGFTGVLVMPSTYPPIQDKSGIDYILNKGKGKVVDVFAAGSLTKKREGKELSEMFDMKHSGALAFTDDKQTIDDASLMIQALLYAKQLDSLIITYCQDQSLSGKALVNESLNTTRLGLKGIPGIAEEMSVARDLLLCRYTRCRMHFSMLTTEGSVQLIREAKKRGLPVTADVSAYHLACDDSLLDTFDSNFKTKPPLRSKEDIQALIAGLGDGTLDAIISDHSPEDSESKKVEFDFAAYGMIGLETAFSIANKALKDFMPIVKIIEKFTNARSIAGLKRIVIKENEKANLTLFDPSKEWAFTSDDIKSKSKNTPFIGEKLIGKVIGIINNNLLSH